MIQLNHWQTETVKEINRREEIARCRKGLTMCRANDPGYALFRVTASNQYYELITRLVAHKPLLKATRRWLDVWMKDPGDIGDLVRDLFHGLERESGYKFQNYKA